KFYAFSHSCFPLQEKTLVSIAVDPESPAQYLQRQKPQREEMPVYTRWVKTQKCMTCGNQADDPHHIIGHGLGGMGTKADDLFVIPLCRKCHNELHAGVKDFEEKHGSQLLLLIRFLMHARNSGVLKWKA
ncbi:DUF968 domain-containing protein, partial [Escherichia coli]|uniref:DUF968 domain-containing protein n=1 Tax=Escherichia coli TaxID=562 RepID=UPI00110539A6